jgi:tetratricopeptide (TPR) repeat protein
MNVANAVGAEFSLAEQESIETRPTDSPEAYRFYLAALGVSRDVAIQFLTRAIEADPDFALAYSLRAARYVDGLPRDLGAPGAASRVTEQEGLARADLARALALDPNLAQAHEANAWIDAYNWRGRAARDNFERAYQLSPNDPTILTSYGTFSTYSGEIEKAIRLRERALELDPNSSLYGLAHTHQLAGNNEAAAAAYREELAREAPDGRAQVNLALLEVARGNVAASDIELPLAREVAQSLGPGVFTPQVAFAYAQLGLNDEAEILLAEFDERAEQNRQSAATWVMAHLARGDEEQALESLKRVAEKTPYEGYNLVFRIKANIFGSAILDQPEFVAVRERLGFTDL